MELRDFLGIFFTHKKIFWSIILISVVLGALYFLLQRQTYRASLMLNVTRDTTVTSPQTYTYDDFYRLQADERFADTIVQWITSPLIAVKMDHVSGKLTAKRLSSQFIDVRFHTQSPQDALATANDLVSALNEETQRLNSEQMQDHWFIIQGHQPIITDGRLTLSFLIMLSGALGFFVAFWAVLVRHYIGQTAD